MIRFYANSGKFIHHVFPPLDPKNVGRVNMALFNCYEWFPEDECWVAREAPNPIVSGVTYSHSKTISGELYDIFVFKTAASPERFFLRPRNLVHEVNTTLSSEKAKKQLAREIRSLYKEDKAWSALIPQSALSVTRCMENE